MHLIILEKSIDVIDLIDDLVTVNLEEDVQYLKNNEGINIKGHIDIEGDYLSQGQKRQFKDKLNIDLLAPYDEIIDKNAILLKISDFDYINGGNKIIFTFKLNIEGWKEISKTFLSSDVSQESEKEPILIESNENPEVIEKLKELLENCKKIDKKEECIEQYLTHGLEEVEQLLNENDSEERDNLIEFNISGENKEKVKLDLDEGTSFNEECEANPILIQKDKGKELEIKINNSNSINDLFKKTKNITFCSYRVIYEGDTYESIANEEKISLFDLKRFNKNKVLKEGVLIKIPVKK